MIGFYLSCFLAAPSIIVLFLNFLRLQNRRLERPLDNAHLFHKLPDKYSPINEAILDCLTFHDSIKLTTLSHSLSIFKADVGVKKIFNAVVEAKPKLARQLMMHHQDVKYLLLTPRSFTDYSDRTFNCTAFEYAYWAKDVLMCEIFVAHMSIETKAFMFELIQALEQKGLTYKQHDKIIEGSKHFDMTPLIRALEAYAASNHYSVDMGLSRDNTIAKQRWVTRVGGAQRDLPAHFFYEYCGLDSTNIDLLSSRPTYQFYCDSLEQDNVKRVKNMFPFSVSENTGLGVDFAIARGERHAIAYGPHAGFAEDSYYGNYAMNSTWLSLKEAEDIAFFKAFDVSKNMRLQALRENLEAAYNCFHTANLVCQSPLIN